MCRGPKSTYDPHTRCPDCTHPCSVDTRCKDCSPLSTSDFKAYLRVLRKRISQKSRRMASTPPLISVETPSFQELGIEPSTPRSTETRSTSREKKSVQSDVAVTVAGWSGATQAPGRWTSAHQAPDPDAHQASDAGANLVRNLGAQPAPDAGAHLAPDSGARQAPDAGAYLAPDAGAHLPPDAGVSSTPYAGFHLPGTGAPFVPAATQPAPFMDPTGFFRMMQYMMSSTAPAPMAPPTTMPLPIWTASPTMTTAVTTAAPVPTLSTAAPTLPPSAHSQVSRMSSASSGHQSRRTARDEHHDRTRDRSRSPLESLTSESGFIPDYDEDMENHLGMEGVFYWMADRLSETCPSPGPDVDKSLTIWSEPDFKIPPHPIVKDMMAVLEEDFSRLSLNPSFRATRVSKSRYPIHSLDSFDCASQPDEAMKRLTGSTVSSYRVADSRVAAVETELRRMVKPLSALASASDAISQDLRESNPDRLDHLQTMMSWQTRTLIDITDHWKTAMAGAVAIRRSGFLAASTWEEEFKKRLLRQPVASSILFDNAIPDLYKEHSEFTRTEVALKAIKRSRPSSSPRRNTYKPRRNSTGAAFRTPQDNRGRGKGNRGSNTRPSRSWGSGKPQQQRRK